MMRTALPDYRAEISGLEPEAAVAYLLERLEAVTFLRPAAKWESRMPLFPARLVSMLEEAAPRAVSYAVIYDALTWGLADGDLPEFCTVRTWAKRARAHLPPDYRITAVRGFGYRLDRVAPPTAA